MLNAQAPKHKPLSLLIYLELDRCRSHVIVSDIHTIILYSSFFFFFFFRWKPLKSFSFPFYLWIFFFSFVLRDDAIYSIFPIECAVCLFNSIDLIYSNFFVRSFIRSSILFYIIFDNLFPFYSNPNYYYPHAHFVCRREKNALSKNGSLYSLLFWFFISCFFFSFVFVSIFKIEYFLQSNAKIITINN